MCSTLSKTCCKFLTATLHSLIFSLDDLQINMNNKINVQTRVWRSEPSKCRPYAALPPLTKPPQPKLPKDALSYPELPKITQS